MTRVATTPVAEPWSEVVRLTQAVRDLEAELRRQEPVMEAASALYHSTDWHLNSPRETWDVYGAYRDYLSGVGGIDGRDQNEDLRGNGGRA